MVYAIQKEGRGEAVYFAIVLQSYSKSVGIVGGRGQSKTAGLVDKRRDVNQYLVKAKGTTTENKYRRGGAVAFARYSFTSKLFMHERTFFSCPSPSALPTLVRY